MVLYSSCMIYKDPEAKKDFFQLKPFSASAHNN